MNSPNFSMSDPDTQKICNPIKKFSTYLCRALNGKIRLTSISNSSAFVCLSQLTFELCYVFPGYTRPYLIKG